MNNPVKSTLDDGILTIEIDHPPVNALALPVRAGLLAAMQAARTDARVQAVILQAAGRTFVAGGDIGEFAEPAMIDPHNNHVFAAMEALDKPIVAALHGSVLGGGLELAMAAHYRVALPGTKLGLPEVKLGIVPGAGGTQRLPRLVGVETALKMMTSGQAVDAGQALTLGLIDELASAPLRDAALALARKAIEAQRAGQPLPIASRRAIDNDAAQGDRLEAWRRRLPAPERGGQAAHGVLQCVQAACSGNFERGLAIETEVFEALRLSPASLALCHVFFAEREAARIPGLARDIALRPVAKVGIVGAGTMGGGIAMNFVDAGIPVVMVEVSDAALQRGLGIVRANYEASAAKGRISAEQLASRMALLHGSLDYAALADCDLVIEAVFENLALKQQVCARLGAVARPGAIIATNTSTLDVDVLAAATGRAADVVGMHFFSPANVMRLLEVVRGAATAPPVLATVMKLAATIGKVPVVSGVCYGFIGNRMAEVYLREAEYLLMEGASPARIDRVVEDWGMAMGPCRMIDMAGVDVAAKTVIEATLEGKLGADPSYRAVVRRLHELGRHGQKTGAGYYRYEGRKAVDDPETARIVAELAARHGIARRSEISDAEIFERLLYPLFNEGLKIVEERIAYRAGDIDVVWTAGYGFPAHRGGPMWAAGQIGLRRIAERLAHYGRERGNAYGYWTPAAAAAAA